jgi:hypothetical protein
MALTPDQAGHFARIALAHIAREYPSKLDHVIGGKEDLRTPRELHPAFYGSFDWHSSVHGHWLLARLYRSCPDLAEAPRIRAVLDAHLDDETIAGELAYLARPSAGTFERPSGWAWLLALAAELARHDTAEGRRWSAALRPLADAFADRFRAFLPRATYPQRVGTHFNSAFALALVAEWDGLRDLAAAKAREWYGRDADCQAWEPGGDEFLSPALAEAECMRRLLPRADFLAWLDRFLPRLASGEPATLFTPATVSDRSDGKIVHLDGLNLSRAWCWRALAASLEAGDGRRDSALDAAERHLDASLPHVAGDYMGEHWLATYAVLALDFPS